MPLPEYPHVRFAKSPLKLVIAQVRSSLLIRFRDAQSIANFQDAIADTYPDVDREEQPSFRLTATAVTPKTNETLYRFSERTGDWSIVLGEDSLTLEGQKYASNDDLLARFQHVLIAAQAHLGLRERHRLGLRYINEFQSPQAGSMAHWREQFKPEFLGFAAFLFDEAVSHMVQEVQVHRPDGRFVVRHGLLGGNRLDVTAQEPFYLLDLDYSDARPGPLDLASSAAQLKAYNRFCYNFFRWTLSDRLADALEPQNG